MELFVAGCHGGETPKHRTSAFVVDGRIAIDAGALTSGLSLKAQCALDAVLVSHAHMDHVRDLATIADNRTQLGAKPLEIVGIGHTIDALRKHFFNGLLWPDFTRIPTAKAPAVRYRVIDALAPTKIGKYRVTAVPVTHTIDCVAFIVETPSGALAYSGDTGPTDLLWERLNETKKLRLLLMEVSFPDDEQRLATVSGHHTPKTLAEDLRKYKNPSSLDVLLYHIKPTHERQVERECARLRGLNLSVPRLGDVYKV